LGPVPSHCAAWALPESRAATMVRSARVMIPSD
jgi:hypothetical protein